MSKNKLLKKYLIQMSNEEGHCISVYPVDARELAKSGYSRLDKNPVLDLEGKDIVDNGEAVKKKLGRPIKIIK